MASIPVRKLPEPNDRASAKKKVALSAYPSHPRSIDDQAREREREGVRLRGKKNDDSDAVANCFWHSFDRDQARLPHPALTESFELWLPAVEGTGVNLNGEKPFNAFQSNDRTRSAVSRVTSYRRPRTVHPKSF